MWYEKYLSIPFEPNKSTMQSCDCAGLIFLVLQQELGIQIERASEDDFNAKEKHELINKYLHLAKEVKREEIQPFDIFYQMSGEVFHIGFIVDANTVLEATLERGIKLNSISRILHKPTKFYRVIV